MSRRKTRVRCKTCLAPVSQPHAVTCHVGPEKNRHTLKSVQREEAALTIGGMRPDDARLVAYWRVGAYRASERGVSFLAFRIASRLVKRASLEAENERLEDQSGGSP